MTEQDAVSVIRDNEKEDKIERLLDSINKNLIIHNTVFTNCDGSKNNFNEFFYKLDLMFKQLLSYGYLLDDVEKIEIALCKGSDYIIKTYVSNKSKSYEEFKKLFNQEIKVFADEVFNENEWVRVHEDDNFLFDDTKGEIGFVAKIYQDGYYELVCKGKMIKIHGSKLSKL